MKKNDENSDKGSRDKSRKEKKAGQKKKQRKSYLIPLLIAVGILVLVIPVWTAFNRMTINERSKCLECEKNCLKIYYAARKYKLDHGRFPKKLSQLVPDYLSSIPTCPSAGKDTYSNGYNSAKNPSCISIQCMGHNHKKAFVAKNTPSFFLYEGNEYTEIIANNGIKPEFSKRIQKAKEAKDYEEGGFAPPQSPKIIVGPQVERESYKSDLSSKAGYSKVKQLYRIKSGKNTGIMSHRYGGPSNVSGTISAPPSGTSYSSPPTGTLYTINDEPRKNGKLSPQRVVQDVFFEKYKTNPFTETQKDNLSTFSIDVDTASYSIARSYLNNGVLPTPDGIRVEEFINYFSYGYPSPGKEEFTINTEAAPARFAKGCTLFRVGIKGKEVRNRDRKRAILTFVIDVSGSMEREDRLGLVKKTLHKLLNQLKQGDKVGIVIYGSNAEILLPHQGIENRGKIIEAIYRLTSTGCTNVDEGLNLGYRLANRNYRKNAVNRVILCSDGVANNGVTDPKGILKKVKEYSGQGIYLTTVGFGMENYNDHLLEHLADNGNGQYAYVDTPKEAERIFVKNLAGTFEVIAKDVKIQVDFNPVTVKSYRLMGYENRDIKDEDFRNDKKDAGEVGAGHSVTALYELKLNPSVNGRLAKISVRYKNPKNNRVKEIAKTVETNEIKKKFEDSTDSFKLSSSIAEFAEILRKSYYAKDGNLKDVRTLIKSLGANYRDTYDVKELLNLVATAQKLSDKTAGY